MRSIITLTAALAGCAAQVPTPTHCDMPPSFARWIGAQVKWTGVVIGEPHHGYVLACEHHRSGIRIHWNEQTVGARTLQHGLDRTFLRHGFLRITVEGRLGRSYGPGQYGLRQDPPVLRISAVRSAEWVPMTEREVFDFLNRTR